MFCGIWSPTYRTLAAGVIRHGDGSGPTTGHQNRSAEPRNSACSRRWIHSFSSASVEQRREVARPHDDREQEPRDDREREEPHDPRVEHRQDPATAGLRRRRRSRSVIGPAYEQEQRRHEGQQQVLDHVDREQRRVVALDPRVERDQDAPAPRASTTPSARAWHRVRRVARGSPGRTPVHHSTQRDDRRQPDERVERPAEEEAGRVGRDRRRPAAVRERPARRVAAAARPPRRPRAPARPSAREHAGGAGRPAGFTRRIVARIRRR